MLRRCPECGSGAYYPKSLANHVVYVCGACGYKTRASTNHAEAHTHDPRGSQATTLYQPSFTTTSVKPDSLKAVSGIKTVDTHPELGWKVCTACQVSLLEKNFERHMRKAHGIEIVKKAGKKESVIVKAKAKAPADKATCPECSIEVGKSNLQKHVRESHDYEEASQHELTPLEPSKVVKCKRPYCSAELYADEMARHLRVVHSIIRVTQHKSTSSLKKHVSTTKGQRKSRPVPHTTVTYTNVEALEQSYFDRRDGSRGYADPFRENGRYGSHPVYDDYDDESFPD